MPLTTRWIKSELKRMETFYADIAARYIGTPEAETMLPALAKEKAERIEILKKALERIAQ